MKRILSLLIAFTIIFSVGSVSLASEGTSLAESTITYDAKTYNDAKYLLDHLLDENIFSASPEQTVTRGEFVKAAVKIFNIHGFDSETVYADVPQNHPCADAITTAYKLKWISAAENFNPDEKITYAQAVKIILNAANYEEISKVKGGFPIGYLIVANYIDLVDNLNIEQNSPVSVADATIMFYNIMLAPLFDIVSITDSINYKAQKITYLEKIYDARYVEGILTATQHSSVVLDAPFIKKNGRIEIDGIRYSYADVDVSMLGKHVEAYYADSGDAVKELLFVIPSENQEFEIASEDYGGIDGNNVKYYKNGKVKKARLDSSYKVIYNGRRVAALQDSMLSNGSYSIRLLSNNDDEAYEYIFVDAYDYGVITSIDYVDGYVAFKTPSQLIDITDDDECTIFIHDENGVKKELFELAKDNAVAIKASDDGKVYDLTILSNIATGVVGSVSEGSCEIEINGTTYKTTKDFSNSYFTTKLISTGDSISAAIGIYGELTCLISSSVETKYGIINGIAASKGLKANIQLRILTTDSKFEIYDLSDKVMIDGASSKVSREAAYTVIKQKYDAAETDAANPVLVVKYTSDENGKINMIDFADTDTAGFDSVEDTQDSLTRYVTHTQLAYRNAAFPSKALLNNAVIIVVPEDPEERDEIDNYTVGTYNMLSSNHGKYTVDVYDVDETGNAAYVVIYQDRANDNMDSYETSYMIEKVIDAIVDDEYGVQLQCWSNKKFVTLFMSDDIKVDKKDPSVANELVPGDFVRFKLLGDKVLKVLVDYDMSSGTPRFVASGGDNALIDQQHALSFLNGKVYNATASSVLISNTKDSSGEYVFNYENLGLYPLNDTIACFYRDTNTIRTMKISDIRTYKGFGQSADTIYLRSDCGYPRAAFVIR